MKPIFQVLEQETITKVIDEAIQLLSSPGVKIGSQEALELLDSFGAVIDQNQGIARIPERLVVQALKSVPREFNLFNAQGEPVVKYADNNVHFDPGSSGVHILDFESSEHRPTITTDLIRIIQVAEELPEYDAQSTAVICHDVPEEIGDLYRLYLVLLYSRKPIVTGAFETSTGRVMFELLAITTGTDEVSKDKPRAIFDVCPSPPLNWTNFASQNLIDLARAKIPAQIVSMPLTGATSPTSLIGAIVQHAAECLSGITIHQLANPGAPIVWGGAPAAFDMRYGTTSLGAAETSLIVSGYTQVGKYFNLPTHAYLVATDSKTLDAQSGMESGASALTGILSGINMISGPGMLDSLACLSLEKLVLDAEAIAMAKRHFRGIDIPDAELCLAHYENFEFPGNFLQHRLTRDTYRKELYMPTNIIDRNTLRNWKDTGQSDSLLRAHDKVSGLIKSYQRPPIPADIESELSQLVLTHARQAGMDNLPGKPEN
jgi:trimethylamine--corrinoid protein Co-methyltransferase